VKKLLVGLLCLSPYAYAAANEEAGFEFFQEEAKVVIAAQREQSLEEAPSIVSVITRQEMEAYGDRDLADVLRRIPGFEFGIDVYSEAGPLFRGIWVEEGKSLLMINGMTQNELGFGTYSFFGSIPASMIERVEVIRGPGSAIYGGFAEVDVINVVTHQPENLQGARMSVDAGIVGSDGRSLHGNLSIGNAADKVKLAAHVGYGETVLSTRDYSDFFGGRLDLDQDNAYRRWQHIVTEASVKDLTLRYQRTSFTFGAQDTFVTLQPAVNGENLEQTNNYNDAVHLDYKWKLADRFVLQPVVEYTRNNTWNFNYPASIDGLYAGSGTLLRRYRGEMNAVYDAPWSGEARLGVGQLRDEIHSVASTGAPGLQLSADPSDLSSRAHSSSAYGLFQYLQKLGRVGLTVGGRYEDTSFGNAFAPRAGVTYMHNAFNAKLLYGRAFRIPLLFQSYSRALSFTTPLEPETADTTEVELGYKFTRNIRGKINAFFIDIDDPIVYQGVGNTYVNFGRIQSQGAEAEVRADYPSYGGFTNIAYAEPTDRTSPGFVTVSKKRFLGSPPVKINAGTYYRMGIMEFAPSLTYLSPRSGQSEASANDPSGTLGTMDYPALVLVNMNIVARNVLKDLDVHLGVHNLFDVDYLLIQPYYGGHAPLPAQDRHIELGATWRL
jgi:outer membrane cobalamin receptor